MARSIYIASLEGRSGKSLVALGVLDALVSSVQRAGVFRPITRSGTGDDHVLRVLVDHPGVELDYDDCIGVTYDDVHADPEAAISRIMERYREVERACDAVVIVGSDYTDVAGPTELTFNARIAANLGAPVLLVVSGDERTPEEVHQTAEIALPEIVQAHAGIAGVLANRCDPDRLDEVRERLGTLGTSVWALPEVPLLSAPIVADLQVSLDADLMLGDPALLQREAENTLVCGMNTEHLLERLVDGQLCIVSGDRAETIVALATAHAAEGFASLAAVVINGEYRPSARVLQLVEGLGSRLPIICTDHSTYDTARIVASTRGYLGRGSQRKAEAALRVFDTHLEPESLLQVLDVPRSEVVTPLMFESAIIERARAERRRIVLPEGDDDRILKAASAILARDAADLVLLGDAGSLTARAVELGLDLTGATFEDPRTSELLEPFAEEYARLRAHRGMDIERARELVRVVSYFGTLMVHLGHADGMVSGAAHTTAHTITPAFEIIRTVSGTSVVSSVFFMCLEDRVLVYGDCAVIPDPTAAQLADIAISSAETAAQFGVEPRVAMLSYSTGDSGGGVDVDKVREGTRIAQQRRPDLQIEGPMQYDAAVDAAVGQAKLPGSEIAGRATVFIFPDLNTGNNTYKAVQRSAGAVAVGPVLQGLNKPVNDLSRGASVRDIVNTVAITAVQAQSSGTRPEGEVSSSADATPTAGAAGSGPASSGPASKVTAP